MSTYTIPNVITRSAAGERVMDVYSHLLAERIVDLGTAIDSSIRLAITAAAPRTWKPTTLSRRSACT